MPRLCGKVSLSHGIILILKASNKVKLVNNLEQYLFTHRLVMAPGVPHGCL